MTLSTLSTDDLATTFREKGYVIVPGVFDPATDYAQLFADWGAILDEIADECIADGVLGSRYESLPFPDRFVAICRESGRNFPQRFDIALPQKNIRRDTPVYAGPGVFSILTNERLLDVLEAILGPEVMSNPIQHTRMKLPMTDLTAAGSIDGKVAPHQFHQDQGVALPEADESGIVTCWIAITDADEENDCLQIYPETALGGLLPHCPAGTPAMVGLSRRGIPPRELPAGPPTPVVIKAGSIIVFNGRMVHGSHGNHSQNRMRISLDLRYQPSGLPTGRPGFPEFIARSRSHPESVLTDPRAWHQMWMTAREQLADREYPNFFRWDADCADCQ
jgi:phytanoyl-CoA hydroxylase